MYSYTKNGSTYSFDLSIIVVSWNTKELTRSCLTSIRHNTEGLRIQTIVVDNHSCDGSQDMISEEFPEMHLIQNEKNLGFAKANNQALDVAKGRYVLLLNSDTVILGNVIEASVQYMEITPAVGVMGCRVLNADLTVQQTCMMQPSLLNSILKVTGLHRIRCPRWFGREHYRAWARNSERSVGVVTGCYMMVRGDAIREVGLLDSRFFFNYEESDWCFRFQKAGWKTRFNPVGDIIHFGGGSSAPVCPDREFHMLAGKLLFFRKHYGRLAAWWAAWISVVFWLSRYVVWKVQRVLNPSLEDKAGMAVEVLRRFFFERSLVDDELQR